MNIVPNYRVEKDNRSFHVPADQIEYYANNGYTIYRNVEQEVVNPQSEVKEINEFLEEVANNIEAMSNEA